MFSQLNNYVATALRVVGLFPNGLTALEPLLDLVFGPRDDVISDPPPGWELTPSLESPDRRPAHAYSLHDLVSS